MGNLRQACGELPPNLVLVFIMYAPPLERFVAQGKQKGADYTLHYASRQAYLEHAQAFFRPELPKSLRDRIHALHLDAGSHNIHRVGDEAYGDTAQGSCHTLHKHLRSPARQNAPQPVGVGRIEHPP